MRQGASLAGLRRPSSSRKSLRKRRHKPVFWSAMTLRASAGSSTWTRGPVWSARALSLSSAAALRSLWSNAEERAAIIDALEKRGVSFDELASATNEPDADPFDLLCHVAFRAPLRPRR